MKDDLDLGESAECAVCTAIRARGGREQNFIVTPLDGGGWQAWNAALLRLFQRIGSEPTRALILSQPLLNDRYAQVLVGHGIAHPECSSNVYLIGASMLSDEQHELLDMLGWTAPASDVDDPGELPSNWTLPHVRGDWAYLVDMLMATAIGVFGFQENLPVELRSFHAENPCARCSWGDPLDPAHDTQAS